MPAASQERLLLLDTASLYYRAYYGMPDTMRAPDGTPINAVRGMLDFAARLITDHSPTRFVAALDANWRPSWRVELLPSYKAHRVLQEATAETTEQLGLDFEESTDEGTDQALDDGAARTVDAVAEMPDELSVQIPLIVEIFQHFGLATLGVDDFEADDVIGTLTHRSQIPVGIVTGDRDLFQLVDDALVRRVLYTAARGVNRVDIVNEAWIAEKYAIPGKSYADFATLRGDPSDGLPGVRGIGQKTAATLLTQFGDLRTIIAAAHDPDSQMTATVRKKLLDGLDYLAVAPRVVAVSREVPVPDTLDDALPRLPRDDDAVEEMAERLGLGRSVERLRTALAKRN